MRWLVRGVADGAHTDQRHSKTVRDFIVEVQQAGVALYACGMALAEHRRADEPLIDGVKMAGAATVIGATVENGTRTLVF